MEYRTESEKQWLCGSRVAASVWAVHPRDGMADWELQLAATASHHKRVLYYIALAQEMIKI